MEGGHIFVIRGFLIRSPRSAFQLFAHFYTELYLLSDSVSGHVGLRAALGTASFIGVEGSSEAPVFGVENVIDSAEPGAFCGGRPCQQESARAPGPYSLNVSRWSLPSDSHFFEHRSRSGCQIHRMNRAQDKCRDATVQAPLNQSNTLMADAYMSRMLTGSPCDPLRSQADTHNGKALFRRLPQYHRAQYFAAMQARPPRRIKLFGDSASSTLALKP